MPLSRRRFLVGGASALVLAACSSGDDDSASPKTTSTTATPPATVTVPVTAPLATPITENPFTLGVASGDPDSTGVVLWTRLMGGLTGDVEVVWLVEGEHGLVAAGTATATDDDAHSVHVLVEGLQPASTYTYSFQVGEHRSITGTTRTTPDPGADVDALRFAFASCQDWQDGYYTAHEHLAAEDIELVVFLGDYIYESGASTTSIRSHLRPEVIELEDYRGRYALYKSDPNLQAAHAAAPWFVIWDDHEVDNDYAGDVPELKAPKGVDFLARKAAGYRAWWEHQPTRLPKPSASGFEIYRSLEWGSLASFFALDGRQHRDDQPCDPTLGPSCPAREDDSLSMLGAEQEA
jgi:alkaline phosphatase D